MKRILIVIVMALLATMLSAHNMSNELAAKVVKVSHAYVRDVPPGAKNTAAFMQLKNTGEFTHSVIAAMTHVSRQTQLHKTISDNGVMKMRQVRNFSIDAGQIAAFKPGGYHIMLIGLKKPLKIGQRIKLNLLFADGSDKEIFVTVKK